MQGGQVSYVEGVKGKAIIAGEKGHIVFRARENFDAKEGAIAVWMRPVDWEDGDGKFHFLFAAGTEKAETHERLLLYKYHNTPQITALADGPAGKNAQVIQKSLDDWDAKTWRHYVMCWSANELALYVDGEPVGNKPRTAPIAEDWEYFSIGRDGFTPEGGNCAFDELKLFDRPLTEKEVAALYAGYSKKKVK